MKTKLILFLTFSLLLFFNLSNLEVKAKTNPKIQTKCLTCGGTITKNYKIIKKYNTAGKWTEAKRPTINGGPHGGSKSYTETKKYSATISGDKSFDLLSLINKVGFSITYEKSFSETQSFKLKKNKKYKLMIRPNYKAYKVRYGIYSMGNGGSQKFIKYQYTTIKKPVGTELNLKIIK